MFPSFSFLGMACLFSCNEYLVFQKYFPLKKKKKKKRMGYLKWAINPYTFILLLGFIKIYNFKMKKKKKKKQPKCIGLFLQSQIKGASEI